MLILEEGKKRFIKEVEYLRVEKEPGEKLDLVAVDDYIIKKHDLQGSNIDIVKVIEDNGTYADVYYFFNTNTENILGEIIS